MNEEQLDLGEEVGKAPASASEPAFRWSEQRTPNGHAADEASSALQKELRRCNEREALYWASELELAGFGSYVWRRLRIVASEDVGLGEPLAPLLVRALYESWQEQRQAKGHPLTASLFLVHAVLMLARARKSRLVDHALIVTYQGEREPLAVPDYALDNHTARGRRMGRAPAFFYEHGAVIEPAADIDDPFVAEARVIDGVDPS